MDSHLNRLFGPTFAQVLEYEAKQELGMSLYHAFRDNPSAAVGVLKRVFRRGEAVGVILENLTVRLAGSAEEKDKELLALFEQAMPLVRASVD